MSTFFTPEQITQMIKLFDAFDENVTKNTISDEMVQEVEEKVHQCWEQALYKIEDVLKLIHVKDFVSAANSALLTKTLKKCGVLITNKDRKRGKNHIFLRFKKRFYSSHVRQKFDEIIEAMVEEPSKRVGLSSTLEELDEAIDIHGFDLVYWISFYYLDLKELQDLIQEHYPRECIRFFTRAYVFYVTEEFEAIMKRPKELQKQIDLHEQSLKQENQQLKKQIRSTKKKKHHLETEMYTLSQEKKQLKQENYELYEEALEEIEALKKTLDDLEEAFQEERMVYYALIDQLTKQLYASPIEEKSTESLSFQGQTVCLIGGEKQRFYQEIVTKYDGHLCYVSVGNFNKICGAISQSNVVFFLTEKVGHGHFWVAYKEAKKMNKPFVFLNSMGISSFEREIQRFLHLKKSAHL